MSIDEYTHKITICPDAVYIRNEKSTNTIYITMKDIHLMNKIMDFYEFLAKNKGGDSSLMNEVAIHRTLDKIKALSKEKRLIIIDEKIKKINSYLNK